MTDKQKRHCTRQRAGAGIAGSIPILFEQPRNCGDVQQSVIATLAIALHTTFSANVNFDHVHLALPIGDSPLSYRGHKYDISVFLEGRVILIDVLNVDAQYWQRGKEAGHGKVQE